MSSDSYYATMAAMRDSFRENLPARISEIESAISTAKADDITGASGSLDQCHALAHKLAGAAGTFGYSDISKLARAFENQVKEYFDFVQPLTDDCWSTLHDFLTAMKSSAAEDAESDIFTKPDWSMSSTEFGLKDKASKSVILIDDDVQATEALRLQLAHFGYSVIVDHDHHNLPELLNKHRPSAVILDIAFPGDPLGGINIVKSLREEDKLHCPLVFISVRGDLEVRLAAIRVGADGYFTKPFELMDLLQSLSSLITPEEEEPYRVVLVDDDQEVATFNAAALNEAGIVTVVVTDPMKVMPPIRELRPDLILMDLQMPGCTGFELAKSIRFDKTYVQTPIIFLTGSDIADAWLKFIKSGGDELLRKTISTQELVAIIHARCKRSRQLLTAINEFKMSEARFRSVAQTAQEAIVTTDVDNRIVFWNKAAEKLFEYSHEEIVGHNCSILFADDTRPGSKFRSGTYESEIKRRDQNLVPVEISTSDWTVIEDSFVTFIFRDITERRDSRDQLIAAKNDAENANRAKSEFLSAMSHDLRTPLNSILGFVSLLISDNDPPLSEDQIESLNFVKGGGVHLLDLINQVLDLSAVETGNITLNLEPIILETMIKDCVDLVLIMADTRDITIDIKNTDPTLAVIADNQRLKDVILNLLSNAVKYNHASGHITVEYAESSSGRAKISVIDTGPGIPAEKIDRLFVAFDRLDAETTETEGTGIGLTIVKRFVEHMDGAVGVSSTVGKGSRFWLELPLAGEGQLDKSGSVAGSDMIIGIPVEQMVNRSLVVLCIEDNIANMRLLQRIFSSRPKFNMIEAYSGEEGLEVALAELPDVILLDIGLPGMDGFETLAKLQSMPNCKDIPVIALSANAMKHDIEKGQEAGFFDYLTKPVVIDELVSAIDKAVEK